jgi:hypothetical protein
MPRPQTLAAALAAAVLSSACYRVSVVTGAAPAATVVDKPWTHSFVIGLVPPAPVDVSKECGAAGVSRVVTQRSFLNGLVAGLTGNLYTPLQITATCAGGAPTSSLGLPPELFGMAPAAAAPAPAAPAPAPLTAAAAPAPRP